MSESAEILLSVRGLCTYFRTAGGRAYAVEDSCFDIEAGKTLALVGESGCGKSVTAMSINTSRGCPYHCTWCSKAVYGDTFRRRKVDAVLDEIAWLKEAFDPDQLWFVDDMFTINKRWVHRFCEQMVARDLVTPFYGVTRHGGFDYRHSQRPSACAGCD